MMVWPLDHSDYTAEAIGAFAGSRTRGVFSMEDCFKVTSMGGNTVKMSGGLAWLKKEKYWGVAVLEKEETQWHVDVGSGVLSRYIAVVLQLDKTGNKPKKELRYGEYADKPKKPVPRRDSYYDEIVVATILQRAGAVEITSADITDERGNGELCGLMRDAVTGIPTEELYTQASEFMRRLDAELQSVRDRSGLMGKAEYAGTRPGVVKDADSVQVFATTLLLDGWQKSGSEWTQTASCPGMRAAYDTGAPWTYKTGNAATDAELQDGLTKICAGNVETLEDAIKATVPNKPTCDVPVYLRRVEMN